MAIVRSSAAFVAAVFLATGTAPAAPYAASARSVTASSVPVRFRVKLHNGETAALYANGVETLTDKSGKVVRRALAPVGLSPDVSRDVTASKGALLSPLLMPKPPLPFAPNQLIVVFAAGEAPSKDVVTIPKPELMKLRAAKPAQLRAMTVPAYAPDSRVNRVFAEIGVDNLTRIARHIPRSRLSMLRARALSKSGGRPSLDIADAFVVHFTDARIDSALALLRKQSSVKYVGRNWYVSALHPASLVLGARALAQARERELRLRFAPHEIRTARAFAQHAIPSNYAVSSSAQSLLNAPGVDAVRAYDEIEETYRQLPGEGETIANISIGDVDDTANASDPCYDYSETYGPSVHLISGQHYIDWPSMPLIPAYVVDSSGVASGSASACGVDPSLGEVGLDFAMMAPLPHELQRPAEMGSGYSDLLGIAPGAHYQLFVPQVIGTNPATSDILATFLAAAEQPAPPSVITASIGFGFDTYGFPGRYFEDDPLVESTIANIVNGLGIVVCISANDGTRTYTNAAIGSSGGSIETQLVSAPAAQTDLEDVEFSTLPSQDYDSGAIDVGGTTLDDIFAAPQNGSPSSASSQNQLTWPETRWTGFASFSSGFGSRVNISAPSDNVLAFEHTFTGAFEPYDAIDVTLQGGTSAAAPEVAAVAAVALQLGRLTGHAFSSPQALRSFLVKTARPVPNVPQADVKVNVGPQVDLGNVVETLLAKGGKHPALAVPRVAIAQRRPVANTYDTTFTSDTAPALIDMQGPLAAGLDALAPITIAPDWEGVPAGAKYRLTIDGKSSAVLATTPWARLTPEQILKAAGLPLGSPSNRTVQLQYVASIGPRQAQTGFSLTFGPADATHAGGVAPIVAPVTNGNTLDVKYDLAKLRNPQSPTLFVSEPGRMIPTADLGYPTLFHPSYSVPLTQKSGTVRIPLNALQGAGVYGLWIRYGPESYDSTDFAFTRVVRGSSVRANAPTLSSDGANFTHSLGVGYGQQYQVRWDVSNVPNATGAIVEISPPAPNNFGNYNSFNNPNGSIPDDNGVDTASVYKKTVSGKRGTVTLNGKATLTPALWNTIRVIPMNGTTAAGEASDVSSITEDGIVPPDGLPLEAYTMGNGKLGMVSTSGDGFGDAFALSGATPYAMTWLPIDIDDSSGASYFFYPNGTVFPGDYQFMQYVYTGQAGASGGEEISNYLWNLDQATLGQNAGVSQIALPAGVTTAGVTYNRGSSLALWVFDACGSSENACKASVASMTLPSTSFGTLFDASAAYDPPALYPGQLSCSAGGQAGNCWTPASFGAGSLEVDPGLNEAVLEVGSTNSVDSGGVLSNCYWQGHVVSTISLANGGISTFATGGLGQPTQSSYDASNHVLVSPDDCGNLVITNVQAQTNTVIPLGSNFASASGGEYAEIPVYDVVDSVHHVILIGFAYDPNFATNNAAMSLINEYDENGNLLKSFKNVMFNNELLTTYLQTNENTRTMFVPELSNTQIEPLKY